MNKKDCDKLSELLEEIRQIADKVKLKKILQDNYKKTQDYQPIIDFAN